jgi:hypothetical protein
MARAFALVLLLFVVGEATGSIEFVLGDDCGTSSAPCDASCPACVLCSCCAVHAIAGQPAARTAGQPDATAFVSVDAHKVPASHHSAPPRQPPKLARA